MLERKIEDIDAGEELLLDRKKQAKGMAAFQGIFAIFALLTGLMILHTPGMKLIDGLVLMILSLVPMMFFVGYWQKADFYNVLLKLNRLNTKKTYAPKKKQKVKKDEKK